MGESFEQNSHGWHDASFDQEVLDAEIEEVQRLRDENISRLDRLQTDGLISAFNQRRIGSNSQAKKQQ